MRSWPRRLAYGLTALLLVFAGLLAIGARLIDTPAVRAELQRRLSAALGGEVAWEALELRILPAPHGELRRVRIEIPGALSARAEQLDAYLRLWPLFRGHAEIASLSMSHPEIRIDASGGAKKGEALEPLAVYRRTMAAAAQVLRRFAPDTQFTIEAASIDLAVPAFELRNLNVTARTAHDGLDLELDAASNFWKRLHLQARVEYADLSARASLQVDSTLFEEAKATLRVPAAGALQASAELSGIDLPQALAVARRRLRGLEAIESIEGRLSAKVDLALGDDWRADVQVVKSDAAVKIAQLPWKLSAQAGHITLSGNALDVKDVRGALGQSSFADVAARLDLGKPLRLSAGSGRASLRLEQWFPWLRERLPRDEVAALSGGIDVALQRLALRFDRPAQADYEALVTPRAVSVALKALPAPVTLTGGAVRVDAARVRPEKLAVAMLDAKAEVSGTFAIRERTIEAAAEGVVGEKLVRWALERAAAPAGAEPKTPLRFAARRIAWGPKRPLELDARIDFDGGPQLGLALAWQPQRLELRRLTVKDAQSDATIGALVGDKLLQANFSGLLFGRSIAAMQRRPESDSGSARGELRLTIDREHPARTYGEGHLEIEALELGWLTGRKTRIERVDFTSERTGVRISEARVNFEEQAFTLRGAVQRTAQGPVIDAQLESPGVVIERLLPPEKPGEKGGTPPGEESGKQPGKPKFELWPLPLTGSIAVRAGFVQYGRNRIAPLEGTLALERERAHLDVKQARMCGVSFPLTAEATAATLAIATQLTMRDEPLAAAMRCLTGGTLEISGNADLRAELRTQGRKEEELIRNLSGSAQAELRKGRVKKFALIGSILSLRNIASLKTMEEEGFPYRKMTAKGRFANGEFVLEEGFFDSDAARIAANGTIDLHGANSHLNVLVGLLTTVDRVAGAIPIIGDVFGGSMLALPVGVSGDIRNPLVVPLGPRAVTDRLLGIFERTLKLPGKLIVPPAGETAPPAGETAPPAGEAPFPR